MTVLITGATGRIGSRLVPRLLRHSESVRILAREPARAQALEDLGAEIAAGDVCDEADLERALAGVEAVVHLAAAFRGVPDAEAVAVNDRATAALGRAAVDAGIRRFVFASTNLVYGPGRGRPAREDDEPAPDGAYGIYPETKAAAERTLAQLHHETGLDVRNPAPRLRLRRRRSTSRRIAALGTRLAGPQAPPSGASRRRRTGVPARAAG